MVAKVTETATHHGVIFSGDDDVLGFSVDSDGDVIVRLTRGGMTSKDSSATFPKLELADLCDWYLGKVKDLTIPGEKVGKTARLDDEVLMLFAGRSEPLGCRDVQANIGTSASTALRSIKRLVKAGRLDVFGSGKMRQYCVPKQAHAR